MVSTFLNQCPQQLLPTWRLSAFAFWTRGPGIGSYSWAKERIEKENHLEEKYSKAKIEFERDPNNLNVDILNSAKEDLELFYEEKVRGIIIRARARWYEHGEKSTKYFLNLEKRNHIKKHMRKLKISGSITTDPFDILSEQQRFYQGLYTSINKNVDATAKIESFLRDLNIPKLSEEQKLSCEGKITLEECALLLETFQNNKTPGNDGIPIEFYRKFWPLISEPFTKCANECFEKGEMSRSQKQAVITLIEKKGKDRSFLENWRPISLVNVDAKLMSKVLATRLKNVLPQIIHHNQTGFVKDRYIGETVRSIFDIMDFTATENFPGLMIFIDFQKAFDTIEWCYLQRCLESFNFGPEFIRWVMTFYNNIQSCVINNGITSDYFTLERGVRQGDPLSPYLFIIAVETLAIAVRQNTAITGITIGKNETKLLQYADDTTAVLSDVNSARIFFKLFDDFKKLSGLAINPSKSYIHHILKQSGGFFLFRCNYDVKDVPIRSQFYSKLLQWWSEFRIEFDAEKDWQNIIWNNKDIRINNKSVFYKNFFESGIIYVNDLLFELNNIDSYNVISNIINKTNFLVWAGLRHSIPSHLKTNTNTVLEISLSLMINNMVFDVLEKTSKHYYSLLISTKAKFPNNAQVLKHDFNLNEEQLKKVFILPHIVSSEPYVRAFQYKVLNAILFTNTKLFKIGFIIEDKCSFCKSNSETLSHLLFDCIKTKNFWRDFESYFYSLSKEFVHLTLKDVIVGVIITECPLLNY